MYLICIIIIYPHYIPMASVPSRSKAPPGAADPSPAANFAASPAGRCPSGGRAGPRGARTLGPSKCWV